MTTPQPLTPADCDLRDFRDMPLAVQTLFQSDFWLIATSDEKAAAIELWGRSWHQVPSGSIPADDRLLAALSGAREKWPEVKANVLSGWVACSDGRLYHPTVCTRALEGWLEKLAQRISSGAGNAKRWGIAFDQREIDAQIEVARKCLMELNPLSRALAKRKAPAARKADRKDDDATSPVQIPPGSQGKGREGKGDIGGEPPITPPAQARGSESPEPADLMAGLPGEDEPALTVEQPTADATPAAPASGPIVVPAAAKVAAKAVRAVKEVDEIDLPEWMPAQEWSDFVAMRKRMGKAIPFTEAAARGIVRKLTALRDEGQDPAAVLEASVRNSWRDVFALKAPMHASRGAPARTVPGHKYAAAAAAIWSGEAPRNQGEVIDV